MKKLALALLASLALSTGAQALETGVAPKVTELGVSNPTTDSTSATRTRSITAEFTATSAASRCAGQPQPEGPPADHQLQGC